MPRLADAPFHPFTADDWRTALWACLCVRVMLDHGTEDARSTFGAALPHLASTVEALCRLDLQPWHMHTIACVLEALQTCRATLAPDLWTVMRPPVADLLDRTWAKARALDTSEVRQIHA